jgi:hypothetical protein
MKNNEIRMGEDRRPGLGNDYMIPSPNPRGRKAVKMPVIKKKPVKGPGAGEKAYPMPGITRSTGGGIVGTTGVNVNSAYNTYP